MHEVLTTATEQHGRDLPSVRSVWNVQVIAPAIVLGSRQTTLELDDEACRSYGVEIVRRRSGGGMVFLAPGAQVWLDVVIPRSDVLWSEDVAKASWWLGDVWRSAIESLGIPDAFVHRESLSSGDLGDLVCFAGAGPGEVMATNSAGRTTKIVGMSQRRTKDLARFQCTVYLQWEPNRLLQLVSASNSQRIALSNSLTDCVTTIDRQPNQVVDAFLGQLTRISQ
ncbi:MAG: hypothetical protein D4R44_02470 [Actinobacteria bacterium]|nr:MAG: hypothetical protein D4R44_02470 [Actinomycetota bacterium]